MPMRGKRTLTGRIDKALLRVPIFALAGLLAAGCSASPWKAQTAATGVAATTGLTSSATPSAIGSANPDGAPGASAMPSNVLPSPGAGVTQPPPLPGSAPSRGADPRAVDEMVARIAERESLDAAARARMAEDLRQTDPALWPLLTHYFQAALAYRRQADERQAARGGNEVSSAPAGSSAATQSLPLRAELPESAAGERQARAPQKDGPFERAAAQAPTAPLPDPSPHAQPPRESPSERDAGSTQATAKPDAQAQAFSGPAPARTKDTHDAEKAPLKAAPAKAEGEGVVAASYETPSGANARTVEDRLAALIKSLESEARQSPQSSADVAWQARLRLLYLAANRREDALRPIPSVSPAEQ